MKQPSTEVVRLSIKSLHCRFCRSEVDSRASCCSLLFSFASSTVTSMLPLPGIHFLSADVSGFFSHHAFCHTVQPRSTEFLGRCVGSACYRGQCCQRRLLLDTCGQAKRREGHCKRCQSHS